MSEDVILKYCAKTGECPKHLFQRLYPIDWAYYHNEWRAKGVLPNRARLYCEIELSRLVLARLRRRPCDTTP